MKKLKVGKLYLVANDTSRNWHQAPIQPNDIFMVCRTYNHTYDYSYRRYTCFKLKNKEVVDLYFNIEEQTNLIKEL